MGLYLDIFITFFKIGLVSFGGGYAMIPLIQREVEYHHWLSAGQFADTIAVSAMAPGPIAANSATMIGYKLDSIPGAVTACLGVILPSFLLILIIVKFFLKFYDNTYIKAAFYGLRPTIVGVIAFAAVKMASGSEIIGGSQIIDVKSFILMMIALILLIKTKIHSMYLILGSGIIGLLAFR